MPAKNSIILLVVLSGFFLGFVVSADATLKTNAVERPELAQGNKTLPEGPPPLEELRLDLAPFFLFQQKGHHVWIERVIVTFMMAAPKNFLKYDVNNPSFRKMIYELLHSGKPEPAVQEQAMDNLNRQLNINLETTMQISRSVIIVR